MTDSREVTKSIMTMAEESNFDGRDLEPLDLVKIGIWQQKLLPC